MIANTVTGFRVLISIALLFCPVFSLAFYVLYLIAGLSDMIDGTIARRMNTVSDHRCQSGGSRYGIDVMVRSTI